MKDLKGNCIGCGKYVKFWQWRRCQDCAFEYEKELDQIKRMNDAMWGIHEPEQTNNDYRLW